MFNRKSAFAALVALGALTAGSAHAGNVQWSVSVNLPPVGTVVSNVPVYHAPAPVYHAPAPVYHVPAPVYHAPAPVVVYRPVPVAAPVYGAPHWKQHHRHHRHHHQHGRGDRRDYHDRDGRHGGYDRHDEYGDRYGEGRFVPGPRSYR